MFKSYGKTGTKGLAWTWLTLYSWCIKFCWIGLVQNDLLSWKMTPKNHECFIFVEKLKQMNWTGDRWRSFNKLSTQEDKISDKYYYALSASTFFLKERPEFCRREEYRQQKISPTSIDFSLAQNNFLVLLTRILIEWAQICYRFDIVRTNRQD